MVYIRSRAQYLERCLQKSFQQTIKKTNESMRLSCELNEKRIIKRIRCEIQNNRIEKKFAFRATKTDVLYALKQRAFEPNAQPIIANIHVKWQSRTRIKKRKQINARSFPLPRTSTQKYIYIIYILSVFGAGNIIKVCTHKHAARTTNKTAP